MTKEEILKLHISDLNNLVADSDAKRSRLIDLEDELEALIRKKKIDKLTTFSPDHCCKWRNCGCNKPNDKQLSYTDFEDFLPAT